MEAIKFPQHNVVLAEDQPEYQPLPAFYGQIGPDEKHTGFVFCHEFSEEEINILNSTKRIWSAQVTFGRKLNPVNVMVYDPFEAPKEYEKDTFSKSELIAFGNDLLKKYDPKNDGVTDADFQNWAGK